MKRLLRLGVGMLLGGIGCLGLWGAGLLDPPENLSRYLAVVAATYPGPGGLVTIERIPCRPTEHLRFYVVCTDDCEGVWRIVGVRGLYATNLANLNKLPPDPPETMRRAANDAIAAERLNLDDNGARELLGCYLRLAGLHEELVLREGDLDKLARARNSDDGNGLASFAESLEDGAALSRLPIRETPEGFASRFDYWDTASPGRPVVEMTWGLRRDGTIELYRALELPLTDGSGSGNSPDRPPT